MPLYHLINIIKISFKASFRVYKDFFNNEYLQNKGLLSNYFSLTMVHIISLKIIFEISENNVNLLQNRGLTSFNIYPNFS